RPGRHQIALSRLHTAREPSRRPARLGQRVAHDIGCADVAHLVVLQLCDLSTVAAPDSRIDWRHTLAFPECCLRVDATCSEHDCNARLRRIPVAAAEAESRERSLETTSRSIVERAGRPKPETWCRSADSRRE